MKVSLRRGELFALVSDHKRGVPLLFIHGAAGSHISWIEQWEFFNRSNLVIIPDLPGHNNSSGDGFNRVELYAESIKELFQKLSVEKAILAGHSMGGAIAQLFALKYPALLSGLVLVSTGARLRVAKQIFSAIDENYEGFVELSVSFSMSQETPEEKKEAFREMLSKCRPLIAKGDFEACDSFDVMNQVQNIKLPTLIICGDKDLLTPLKYSEFLHRSINRSRLEIIRDAGHMVMLEKAREVNLVIENFLKNIQ